jgi:hypothetical protein
MMAFVQAGQNHAGSSISGYPPLFMGILIPTIRSKNACGMIACLNITV